MATLAVTFAAGSEVGAGLRQLAVQLQQIANAIPDRAATGASTVITFDNAPSVGQVGVQYTAGPFSALAIPGFASGQLQVKTN